MTILIPLRVFVQISTSPVIEVFSNGAYSETLVAALDRELWRESSHNLCELSLPLNNNLRTSGSIGGLSASSAQLSPDDLERFDSGLNGLSPGEFLSDREEPPTPTDRILNGLTLDDDDNTVSLRPLPAVFDSKRNSRKVEDVDEESVKMIDDLSSASGSSIAGSVAALDSHSDLDISAVKCAIDENCELADDLGNDADLLDGLTERIDNVEDVDSHSGLLQIPVGSDLNPSTLESVSFDLSTIMEMSTSAEDVTMPSISMLTKSVDRLNEDDLTEDRQVPTAAQIHLPDLPSHKVVSGSIAALVEEILERCEDIIAPVVETNEPSRLGYRDSFKHSSLIELAEVQCVDRSESQPVLACPGPTVVEESDMPVKLRSKLPFPCDSLVDLKTKTNSYYGATVENPIGIPESESAIKEAKTSARSSRVSEKKSSIKPLEKLDKFVHNNDKNRVGKLKVAFIRLNSSRSFN